MDTIPDPVKAILNASGSVWRFPQLEPITPPEAEDAPTAPLLIIPDETAGVWSDQPTIALFYCKRCKTTLTPNPLCSACRNELAERYDVVF